MALGIEFRGDRRHFEFMIMWLVPRDSKMPREYSARAFVCVQDSRTLLMEAAIHDNARLAELLLQAGAVIDAVDPVSQRAAAEWVCRFMK